MQLREKILVVAPYVTFPDEPGANRFIAIAKILSKKYDVDISNEDLNIVNSDAYPSLSVGYNIENSESLSDNTKQRREKAVSRCSIASTRPARKASNGRRPTFCETTSCTK